MLRGGSMYTLACKQDFTARHFLVGGDWGAEKEPGGTRIITDGVRIGRQPPE
jgi:hypothetical protein